MRELTTEFGGVRGEEKKIDDEDLHKYKIKYINSGKIDIFLSNPYNQLK